MHEIRVVVVDDQRLIRSGLRKVLSVASDITVIGEAANGQEAVELTTATRPDVVLMDVHMPVLNGVAATRRLHGTVPETHVLLLSTFDDDEYVFEGLKAGAVGYLLKDAEDDDLIAAIRVAARGQGMLHPAVTTKVIAAFARLAQDGPNPVPPNVPLSEQEITILRLIAAGSTNRMIAEVLHYTEGTVKQYVSAVMTKLDARDRAHAVSRAKELRLI